MYKYELLRVLSYKSNYNIEEELKLRKNVYNSIFSGFFINPFFHGEMIKSSNYELFCNPISEIRELSEDILDNSNEIKMIVEKIPDAAKRAVIKKIIVNEIQSTNDIEGVQSTKEELRSTIDSKATGKEGKFSRIIDTYFSILSSDDIYIHGIEDIRKIYDSLFENSDSIDEFVEGKLFREEYAYVYKNNKKIHSGVKPSDVNEKIGQLVILMDRKDIPFLIKAAMCHYIIEYIHPFYDGNGRLGRFLMSVYLKRKLDIYTALSISYSINQNKTKYGKLFLEVTNKKNYGELTHFVLGTLDLIKEGQNSIKELIETSLIKMNCIKDTIDNMIAHGELTLKESNIFYLYTQIYAFNEYENIPDNDVIETYSEEGYTKVEVRRILSSLEEKGYLVLKKRKPKVHEISIDMKMKLD